MATVTVTGLFTLTFDDEALAARYAAVFARRYGWDRVVLD